MLWTENKIFKQDLERTCNCAFVPWHELHGKRVLITGATGLIGYTAASTLLYENLIHKAGIEVVALVRDMEAAVTKFRGQLEDNLGLRFIHGTVEDLPDIPDTVDFIIHCACPTASSFFVTNPVETINIIVQGTDNILRFARKKRVSGVVVLSSMEVFGEVRSREKLKENDLGYIDISSPRSSYPEAKRLAEQLCFAYATQYHVPVTVARLAQTFGPGVKKDDKRVFAYVTRCAINVEDVRLNMSGRKENMYLYTFDAASAIMLLLLKGERGTAYNVGNKDSYISVKDMARLALNTFGAHSVSVITNCGDSGFSRFPPDSCLNMDTTKMELTGWTALTGLEEMFRRMAACF